VGFRVSGLGKRVHDAWVLGLVWAVTKSGEFFVALHSRF
jgi:hypothetical protein